jgi:hypothetical protein
MEKQDIANGLRAIAEDLLTLAKDCELPATETPQSDHPQIDLDAIRVVVRDLIDAGKKAEVRALLQKFGAGKLPELKPESYVTFYDGVMGLHDQTVTQ